MTLLLGTIVLGINTDLTEPLFGWRFFTGDFYLVYSIVLDTMALALLAGLLVMMVRRAVVRPPELDYRRPDRDPASPEQRRTGYRWGDWVFVGGLLYLMVTGYALEGVRIAMDRPGLSGYSPVGWLFSGRSCPSATRLSRSCGWRCGGAMASSRSRSSPRFRTRRRCTC